MIIRFLRHILKLKYILLVLTAMVLFGFAGAAYDVLVIHKQKNMVIEFNYPGAEKGLNPDGSIFEISELKSPEVIEKAKENLDDKTLDTEMLRSRIYISTKIKNQSLDDIIASVQNEKNTVYMPTTFYVYYGQKRKFVKNESMQFMEGLEKAYTEYFTEKYSEKNDVLLYRASDYDFSNMDYMEICQLFNDKIASMLNYIKAHQNENRTFYSEDGVNLGMAASKLESFRDVNLEKYYSFIVQNGISKDSNEYIKGLDYTIAKIRTEYDKLSDASETTKHSIDAYNSKIGAVAFIPSVDSKHNYYMSRTTTGIDELTKKSYSDGIEASKTLIKLENYIDHRNKFLNAVPVGEDKKQAAERLTKELSDDLETLSAEVLKTDDEYLEHKTSNYFKVYLRDRGSGNIIIKFMILGFLLAFAIIIFIEFFKKRLLDEFRVFEDAFSSIELVKKKRGE